jgi:hypothetical protein
MVDTPVGSGEEAERLPLLRERVMVAYRGRQHVLVFRSAIAGDQQWQEREEREGENRASGATMSAQKNNEGTKPYWSHVNVFIDAQKHIVPDWLPAASASGLHEHVPVESLIFSI